MNIFIPKTFFKRIAYKDILKFVDNDNEVPPNPTLLYKKLFAACFETGKCNLSQKYLSNQCKCSIRCVQYSQKTLVEREYIQIIPETGNSSTYILIFSDRVQKLIESTGIIKNGVN